MERGEIKPGALILAAAKTCLTLIVKSVRRKYSSKDIEEEMFIGRLPTTLLQMIMFHVQVIVKRITDPDKSFQRNFEA